MLATLMPVIACSSTPLGVCVAVWSLLCVATSLDAREAGAEVAMSIRGSGAEWSCRLLPLAETIA